MSLPQGKTDLGITFLAKMLISRVIFGDQHLAVASRINKQRNHTKYMFSIIAIVMRLFSKVSTYPEIGQIQNWFKKTVWRYNTHNTTGFIWNLFIIFSEPWTMLTRLIRYNLMTVPTMQPCFAITEGGSYWSCLSQSILKLPYLCCWSHQVYNLPFLILF